MVDHALFELNMGHEFGLWMGNKPIRTLVSNILLILIKPARNLMLQIVRDVEKEKECDRPKS